MLFAVSVLFFLLLLNGVFAMAELAMMTSRRSRLQQAAAAGDKGAAAALALSVEPTRFLSTVQVAITMIGILSGAFAESAISARVQEQLSQIPWLAEYSKPISFTVVVLGVTYFSLVLGELVPKRLALTFPEAIASAIARPLNGLSRVAAWPVRLLTFSTELLLKLLGVKPRGGDDISEDDVRAIVSRAASTGIFTEQEHGLFNRIFRVGDMTVRDLMVPRSQVRWIDENITVEDFLRIVGDSHHSHFPVCRGNLDTMVGVVHVHDLMGHDLLTDHRLDISSSLEKPFFVPAGMAALKALEKFKHSKSHIAFVMDEFGGLLGLVTLNDVVAALVGDFGHQGEESPTQAVQRTDGSWLLDGRLRIQDTLEVLGIAYSSEAELPAVSTVAGLVLSFLGHMPKKGESVIWQGWVFEVVDMDGTRIDQVLATLQPQTSPLN